MTTRGEWEEKLSSMWTSQLGFDNEYARAKLNIRLPGFRGQGGVSNPSSTSETREADINAKINLVGLYWRNELTMDEERLVLRPSLRFDHFSATRENFVAPRFSTSYKTRPDRTLSFSIEFIISL